MEETMAGLLQHAVGLHAQGELVQAAAIYRRIIARAPSQPDALHLLGVALTQSGDFEHGAGLIEKSLRINPAQPVAWANLGNAQLAARQYDVALASYERSIALWADYAAAHNGRGSALTALDRPSEALPSFERALELLPMFPEAQGNRGAALLKLQRFEEAIGAFGLALNSRPDDPQLLASRAAALCQRWRYAEALADSDRALQLRPASAEARYARWSALLGLRRLNEVVAETGAALAREPDDPECLVLRAHALRSLGRCADAMAGYERALQSRADFPDALVSLGTLQMAERHYDRAVVSFERLLEMAPDHDFVRGACLNAKLQIFDWSGYAAAVQRILADMDAGGKADLPLAFLAISDDPGRQLRCARAHAAELPEAAAPLHERASTSRERIRVAYISADFLEHPMAYLLAGLFEAHDRARFEIIAISFRSDHASPTAKRLRAAFDRFIDVAGQSDEEIARLIHGLEVDIAVDLMGYTAEERPGILVRRPAPIQVNYIGFPATMGSKHIDYIVADEFVVPPASAQSYAENIAWLPECYQANDDRRMRPAGDVSRAEAGLPMAAFVWCAFHSSYKINPPLFDVWCRLLHAVPDSVLWLVSNTAAAQLNLCREANGRGIDSGRLVFAKREPYPQHLARLSLADLCLDTWPFNGGATTSDALWAGVPTVTRAGRAFASRMSGSLLRTVGLPELVTDSFDDYERVARGLAMDRGALEAVRSRLSDGRRESPLFDTDRFRRHLESAYLMMWERHRRGEAAASIVVPRQPS